MDFSALPAQNPNQNRVILHVDANCFYASVECLYNPDLREKAVAVCGSTELRHGIVLTKNEKAKRAGVQTGQAIWQAKQCCPELVVVPPRFALYLQFSRKLRTLYETYTDKVESYGLDECWLDVSAPNMTIAKGTLLADAIRKRVVQEFGITVSVGVSNNKALAKLGSDYKKPNATTTIEPEKLQTMVWPLPVSDLLFAGPRTCQKLALWNVNTIGDLAKFDTDLLVAHLGKSGLTLQQFALGLDTSAVQNCTQQRFEKSIGNSTTTPQDMETIDDVKSVLYLLADSVANRLRKAGVKTRTIALSIRTTSLITYSAQKTLSTPTQLTDPIAQTAFAIFQEKWQAYLPLRSVGIQCQNLQADTLPVQLDLLGETLHNDRKEKVERTIDTLKERFGKGIVRRGCVLTKYTQITPETHIGIATNKIPK